MWILSFFTQDGIPTTGLNPLVKVLDVETGYSVVDNELMLETGDGFYRYEFNAYEPSRDYAIICDSVTLSGSDRYTYASSGEYHTVLDSIESTVGMVDIRTTLLRKIQTNRLELADGDTDNWTLYDDDTSTPLLTFSVKDKSGQLIVQQPHTPSRRSMADGDVCGSGISPSVDIYMRKSVYDPDEDGVVNVSEGVSDGVYTSTASGIKFAVDQSHRSCVLGTKCIDESGMIDQSVVKYDAATDRLIYGLTNVSGTLSGTVYHNWLLNLYEDDHPQYVLSDGTRSFSSTVSGVYPSDLAHLATKKYIDDQISTISGGFSNYYTKADVMALIGQNQSGVVFLDLGDTQTDVAFSNDFTDVSYVLLVSLDNEVDQPPSEYAYTIVNKEVSGFTVNYSGPMDSDNYKLNWYAALSGVAGMMTSLQDGNYMANLVDDVSPQLGGDLELLNHSIVLNTTPSGYVTSGYVVGWDGEISVVNVTENFNGFGVPLYVKSSGGFGICTAASGTTQMPCIALTLEEGTGMKSVLWRGIARKGDWSWTPGNIIYISTVEGALTNTRPTNGAWAQSVGIAISSDTIRFDPGFNIGVIDSST